VYRQCEGLAAILGRLRDDLGEAFGRLSNADADPVLAGFAGGLDQLVP